MPSARVPWAAWYGESKFEMTFPDPWQVTVVEMKVGPDSG